MDNNKIQKISHYIIVLLLVILWFIMMFFPEYMDTINFKIFFSISLACAMIYSFFREKYFCLQLKRLSFEIAAFFVKNHLWLSAGSQVTTFKSLQLTETYFLLTYSVSCRSSSSIVFFVCSFVYGTRPMIRFTYCSSATMSSVSRKFRS